MLAYVTLGTNDLNKSGEFFDKLFAPLSAKRLLEVPRGIFWGTDPAKPFVGLMTPFDEKEAGCGNGTMVALAMPDRAKADELHKHALSLGCTCEGEPGERAPGVYVAYFRTPEGHKFAAVKIG